MEDPHEPTWREKFFEVDELARQRRKRYEQAEAQLAQIRNLCAWTEDEPHLRVGDFIPMITAVLDGRTTHE